MKYDAFISYRHAPLDIEVSEMVHKKLETFRVPGVIQKSSGKKKITRVFRDKEELTVSSSLSDEILSALDDSEFLVVICSPRTPESQWVNHEVEYFIAKHGREKILPVLIEGEPAASFPVPLLFEEKHIYDIKGKEHIIEQESEPLAADFRAETPKERAKLIDREIFRLAAPILGCKYDDLKQRHRERRNRRVAVALLALFTVVIAFGAYNYWQNQRISEGYRKQQINQSMFLADTAIRLLEQGDRTKSIQVALEALPQSAEDLDRPIVRKAEYALTQALQIYQNHGNLIPSYSVELDDLCSDKVLCSESDAFFVVIDRRGSVYLRDLETGVLIAKKTAADEEGLGNTYFDFSILSDDRVLCYGLFSMTCLNGVTGEVIWELNYRDLFPKGDYDSYEADLFSVSGDESSIAIHFLGYSSIIILSPDDGSELNRCPIGDIFDIYQMSLSNDGSKIAMALRGDAFSSEQTEIYVIDTKTSERLSRIAHEYANCTDLVFLDTGTLLYGTDDLYDAEDTPNSKEGFLSLYDIDANESLWDFLYSTESFTLNLSSTDIGTLHSEIYGDRILLVADEEIMLLDPSTGICFTEFEAPTDIVGIHYGEESGTCVYATIDGQMKWVNLYDGQEYEFADFSINDNFFSMTGGSNTIVLLPMESQTVLVYSVYNDPEYKESIRLNEIGDFVYVKDISFSLDGEYMIVQSSVPGSSESGAEERAILVEIETGSIEDTIEFSYPVQITIPLRDKILFVTDNGQFLQYDFEKKEITNKTVLDDLTYLYSVSEDDQRVAVRDADVITVIDSETLATRYTYRHPREVLAFYLSGDGEYLLLQDKNGFQSICLADSDVITISDQNIQLDTMRIPVFSGREPIVAVPGLDQRIHIIDLITGSTLSCVNAMTEGTFTGTFVRNDTVLVFQSDDGRIHAADVSAGRLIYSGDQVMNFVTTWDFCSQRNTLAAISKNDRAILFSTDETIQPASSIQGFVGFLKNGEGLVILSGEEIGYFPYRDLGDLLSIAKEALMGTSLSDANRVKYYIEE